jgi:hypothetical protein
MRDVGHPIATQYRCRWILGRACGLGVGRKHKGRPARYVRRGAIIGSPTYSNFHSVYMLTLKTCTALSRTPPFRPCRHHLPCIQEQAGGERSWPFDAISSPYTSLTCRMWTFMAFWRCPRLLHPCTQDRTGGSFKQVVVPSVQLTMGHWRMSQEAAAVCSPAPLLIGTGYLRWVPVMLEHDHP